MSLRCRHDLGSSKPELHTKSFTATRLLIQRCHLSRSQRTLLPWDCGNNCIALWVNSGLWEERT